ncbi:thiamine phosphate synthase [Salimicrobium halophilum]|uniref:Thiamine-phosphate synthase n=1 Tax=Salimicrobium halophilum TaxID=86666 RepID=A0A1G8R9Y7_9BACI|nr:thiamine phosphate synthase [Salimicrobium halophilum]SDJ13787.1 thiamine-phosphate diphosphorylase [Salimicrobium halophilum]
MTDYLHTYFIMGSQNCRGNPEEVLKQAIHGGITAFQFREKGTNAKSGEEKVELGHRLRRICKDHGIPFFVNDDIELVYQLEADGVHVGQDDRDIREVREVFPDLQIGLSVSTEEELRVSRWDLADYLGVGPVFKTSSKDDAKEVIGIQGLQAIQGQVPLPVVAIGGIDESNVQAVREAGAGVSVISAIADSEQPEEEVRRLQL